MTRRGLRRGVGALLAALGTLALGSGARAEDAEAVQQRVWKATVVDRIRVVVASYANREFGAWICLGHPQRFQEAIGRPSLRIVVDPAAKEPSYTAGTDKLVPSGGDMLTLMQDPSQFDVSLGQHFTSGLTLWHEAVHAVAHAHERGLLTPRVLLSYKPAALLGGDVTVGEARDHRYLDWAEAALAALPRVEEFAALLARSDRAAPPDAEAKVRAHFLWTRFLKEWHAPNGPYGIPTADEREEFRQLIGFRVDPDEIREGYLGKGVHPAWFPVLEDSEVWKLFPDAAELGLPGVAPTRHRTETRGEDGTLVSVNYMQNWKQGPEGRVVTISISFHATRLHARKAMNFMVAATPNRAWVDAGDLAYLQHGPEPSFATLVLCGPAIVSWSDMTVTGRYDPAAGPPNWGILIVRSAADLGAVRRLVDRIEASPALPAWPRRGP
jgi:hypothetical protein